jgi:hypothetical protein
MNEDKITNNVEDMTLKEIDVLKQKYEEELKELLIKFFEDRPLLDSITLTQSGEFVPRIDTVYLSKEELDSTRFRVRKLGGRHVD